MSEDGQLSGVGRTALGVAYIRAFESRRPDRLFDDPYAQRFFATGYSPSSTGSGGEQAIGAMFFWHASLRTRFFDDYLLTATGEGGCRQVVLLAAGLDTRAFRLDWPPGVTLYELDLPDVLDFKQRAMEGVAPLCTRVVVEADLREDWADRLGRKGFDPSAPTAWLAEGLLIYLSQQEAIALVEGLTRLSAPGSRLSFEFGGFTTGAFAAAAETMPRLREVTSLWKGGLGRAAPELLGGLGWRVRRHDAALLAESLGRPVPEGAGGGYLVATLG